MLVKICGITNQDDAQAAADAGADLLGLIFAESERRASISDAQAILDALPQVAGRCVGVFRDQTFEEMEQIITALRLNAVQLHGRESPTIIGKLQAKRLELRVFRAWEVVSEDDATHLKNYLMVTRANGGAVTDILLDAPKKGAHPTFEVLGKTANALAEPGRRVWLAGGLTPENVTEATRLGAFDGVDVASGVELSPRQKDHAKVQAFVAAARREPTGG